MSLLKIATSVPDAAADVVTALAPVLASPHDEAAAPAAAAARSILTGLGVPHAAVDALERGAARESELRARVAESDARVAELEAIPVNTRLALVELALQVSGQRKQG
jgi:hypothetical protein